MKEFAKWLRQQLQWIDANEHFPERGLELYDSLADILADCRKRAAAVGLPAAVEACNIRPGPITPNACRTALAACLAAIPAKPARPAGGPLTVQEAAELLNLPRRTVNDLCSTGKIRHHRLGNGRGTIRIDLADLEAFRADAIVER
jgi:excisionase family DNA binding protein